MKEKKKQNKKENECPHCKVSEETLEKLRKAGRKKKTNNGVSSKSMNNRLTPKEQYQLKKKQKEKERQRKIQKKKIKKMMMILILAVLIIGGLVFGLINHSSKVNQGTPKIEINPKEYDFGTISMAAGKVQYTYEIRNNGNEDLKINRIWTSCMCTTAKLKVGEKESPEFGMHSSPLFWSQKIAPGETGYLEVTFDPAYHGPQGTGSIIRAVYLSTNDPKVSKAEVRLIANVIP